MEYFTAQYWKSQRLLLLTFLLVHVVIASIHISQQSLTHDEPDYYTYAARWAHGNVERDNPLYDSKSPIVAVALLPRIVKQLADPSYKATDNGLQDIKDGRYFMVIFTIIIALYLFKWIRKSFGAKAWILPMLFFLFDPTVISFSMIITSDMATGACLIATLYHLNRFYDLRQRIHFFAFATWLGISFVCKASLLFLLPLLVLLYLLFLLTGKIQFRFRSLIVYGCLALVISLSVINLAYFGKDSFHSLDDLQLSSSAFKTLASTGIDQIPIPVPASYISALDLLQYHAEIGAGKPESTYPGVFINGQTNQKGGFWYYYLFVSIFKIPIATLLLLAAGILTYIIKFRSGFKNLSKSIFFLFPCVFFFLVLSFFNPLQLGFRHFLLIYPLLFIAIAAVLTFWKFKLRSFKWLAGLLLIYMMASTASFFPHLIAYTNEFVASKKNVYQLLRDSNIDYGQSNEAIDYFVANNPDIKFPSATPQVGKYIVTASQLLQIDTTSKEPKYQWLLNFKPIAHYKYVNFIFNVSEKEISSLQQKSSAR